MGRLGELSRDRSRVKRCYTCRNIEIDPRIQPRCIPNAVFRDQHRAGRWARTAVLVVQNMDSAPDIYGENMMLQYQQTSAQQVFHHFPKHSYHIRELDKLVP